MNAALAVGVKDTQACHFVVKEFHPIRQAAAHGKEVDDAAAQRIFPGGHDLADGGVARGLHLQPQALDREGLASLKEEGVRGEKGGWGQSYQGRGGSHDEHINLRGHRLIERQKPVRDEVLVRREGLVREGLPVGQNPHPQAGGEELGFLCQALGTQGGIGDRQETRALVARLGGTGIRAATGLLHPVGQKEPIGRPMRQGQGKDRSRFGGLQAPGVPGKVGK